MPFPSLSRMIAFCLVIFGVTTVSGESLLAAQGKGIRLLRLETENGFEYQIIDAEGCPISEKYPYIGTFHDGYAVFRSEQYGVISNSGEIVITPEYSRVTHMMMLQTFLKVMLWLK